MIDKPFLYLLCIMVLPAVEIAYTAEAPRHTEFNATKPFDACLLAAPLLMEIGGTKLVRLDEERTVILSVASALVEDDSASDRMRMVKICRAKAAANLLKEQQGIQIYSFTELEDHTRILIENGKETAVSITKLLDITREEARGSVNNLPVVATWYSADRRLFHLAIGDIVRTSPFVNPSGKEIMK